MSCAGIPKATISAFVIAPVFFPLTVVTVSVNLAPDGTSVNTLELLTGVKPKAATIFVSVTLASEPVSPLSPLGPCSPWIPWIPCSLFLPCSPCSPWIPCSPVSPLSPLGPCSPCSPY